MGATWGCDTSILSGEDLFAFAEEEESMGRVRVVGGRKLRDSVTNGLLLNGSETDAMGQSVSGVVAFVRGTPRS